MTLVSYILTSILLSWMGLLAYLAFRWMHPAARHRRAMLWLVVLTSLGLPFFPGAANWLPIDPLPHVYHEAGRPLTRGASQPTINEFCHCEDPGTSDQILYQASRFYDALIEQTPLLFAVLLCICVFFLGRQVLRMIRLHGWIRKYPSETLELEGKAIRLVRGQNQVIAGSLRFFGKYIFWHPGLDALSEVEQKAILLHEYSHIRQWNTQEKLFLSFVKAIWFINPVLYFFLRELECLSEYQADEYASQKVQSRKLYAHLLLKVKGNSKLSLAHFFKGSSVRRRIEFLLGHRKRARLPLVPAMALGLLVLLSGDIVAQHLIQSSIQEIAVYEYMQQAHDETGQEAFCKKCTFEAVDCR